ncbi:magnesium transporter CorA family protein [Candidatus Parcubacteria bacterium]|nr:MAG: magnesium transporter CorA family protein [Candidatus Parcubacteria bacterium]
MLKIYFNSANRSRLGKIKNVREGAWINISEAEHGDLERIADLTDLDLLDLQDALDMQELPRIERHKKSVMLFVRSPLERNGNNDFIHTASLTIIITDKYFITISAGRNSIVREIQKNSLSVDTSQRGKLLVHLLLKISQSFTHKVKEISYEVLSKKKDIEKIKTDDISELIKYEDILNQYISGLVPMRNIFETLVKGTYFQFYQEDQDLFDDMVISIRQSVDICEVTLKSIKSLRESYQIVFTNRLNKVIQFLTAFTIVMTVPTIIGSFYGMNVRLPLADSHYAFEYVILFSLLGIFMLSFFFYKKKWL